MAKVDGSDLEPSKRLRILGLQSELLNDYPAVLPPGTLLMRCKKCQGVFPLSNFSRNAERKYGVRETCRQCRRKERPAVNNAPDTTLKEKWCHRCKVCHPISAFYRDRSQPDGYSRWCREAAIERRQALQRGSHYDNVAISRHNQTLRLCSEEGIDYPGHDIKKCSACGLIKHINEFVNDWTRRDRKKAICLECHQ